MDQRARTLGTEEHKHFMRPTATRSLRTSAKAQAVCVTFFGSNLTVSLTKCAHKMRRFLKGSLPSKKTNILEAGRQRAFLAEGGFHEGAGAVESFLLAWININDERMYP